jgi:hypothetical protein
MAKIQDSDGQIDKGKIAILNIDPILNWIILSFRNMKVLYFASQKWAYMLKSVEKWLCRTRKYKTLVDGDILNYSSIFKFILQYFFMNWCFQIQSFKWFRWKLTGLCNIRVWRPSWMRYSALKKNMFFSFYGLTLKYFIRSTLKLIAHETVFSYNCSPTLGFKIMVLTWADSYVNSWW